MTRLSWPREEWESTRVVLLLLLVPAIAAVQSQYGVRRFGAFSGCVRLVSRAMQYQFDLLQVTNATPFSV